MSVTVEEFLYPADEKDTWDYDAAMRHGHATAHLAFRIHHLIWDACTSVGKLRSVDAVALIHLMSSTQWIHDPAKAVEQLSPIAQNSTDAVTSEYLGRLMELCGKCAMAHQRIDTKYGGAGASTTDNRVGTVATPVPASL